MITAYAKTITVSSCCRLCGVRNPPDMPVVCVDNPLSHKIVRRYYCIKCYRALERAARKKIPELTGADAKAAAHRLAVLLGTESGTEPIPGRTLKKREKPLTGADETFDLVERDVSVDVELNFPAECVLNRVPFEMFYEEARRGR